MIKNKMAKLVGTTMAVAIMLSVAAPTQVNAGEVDTQIKQEVKFNHEQWGYARQELQTALDMLQNDDFSNADNYNRLLSFVTAAQERIRPMDQSNEYVADLQRIINEERANIDIAHRLVNDIICLQQSTEETKDEWINALNEAITYGRKHGLLNDTTWRNATDILYSYISKGEDKTEETDNFDHEQFEYARQEILIAIDLLDNADLTDVNNYDRMMAFTVAAKQRLENMGSNKYTDELYTFVEEIYDNSELALRIINDIQCLKGASEETKDSWINALNEAVIYARENYLLNDSTISTATEILHQYAN